MAVTRANVEATKAFIRARLGNPYVYGGALSNNVRQGTDCSEVWQTVLEMVHGRWRQGRQSEGATTESYRYIPIGGVGPFGTIRVASWRDIPANAAAKLAFHHGPGGGANSHMWGELDGMLIESGGSKGLVTAPRALAINASYAQAWAYLPGPIDGVAGPVVIGPGSVGPEVVALQQRLNTEGAGLEVDGDYGPATTAAVTAFHKRVPYAQAVLAEGRRRGITPRGIQIAFSVVFVESGWKMYANSKVPESLRLPHDAVGSDYDSVGLFQQRCPMWGPANVLMDPTKSAGLFYDRLQKMDYNSTARPAGDYAADIQRPAAQYRGRYQERMGHAVALYNRITTTTPEGDDDLSAEAERMIRELHTAFLAPIDSASPLRKPGEGKIHTLARLLRYVDGNLHPVLMRMLAELNHPDAMRDLKELADVDLAKYPDSKDGKLLATAILADVNKPNVTVNNVHTGSDVAEQVRAAVSEIRIPEPQIVYTPAPEPVTPVFTGSPGQIIGQAFDAIAALDINADLPPESKATLNALIAILQAKTETAK